MRHITLSSIMLAISLFVACEALSDNNDIQEETYNKVIQISKVFSIQDVEQSKGKWDIILSKIYKDDPIKFEFIGQHDRQIPWNTEIQNSYINILLKANILDPKKSLKRILNYIATQKFFDKCYVDKSILLLNEIELILYHNLESEAFRNFPEIDSAHIFDRIQTIRSIIADNQFFFRAIP